MKTEVIKRKLMACHGPHLGDVWAAVNSCILYGYNISKICNSYRGTENIERKIKEVKDLLVGGDEVKILTKFSVEKFKDDESLWGVPYADTKIKWENKSHGRICYQFDGITSSSLKNLSRKDEELFFSQKYDAVRLGGHVSLEKCVKIAATSDLFVGVCSGMSHLCHSVGVPVYLVGHHRLHEFHMGKKYVYCRSMEEFISKRSNSGYSFAEKKPPRLSI